MKDDKYSDHAATTTSGDLVVYEDTVNNSFHYTDGVVDAGASLHVTSKKGFFCSYTAGNLELSGGAMMACQRLLAWVICV